MRTVYTFTVIALATAVGCQKSSTTTTTSGETTTTTTASSNDAASFDRQFIDMMVPHHEQAMMIGKMAEERAEHAEVKTLARKMVDDQQREVGEMKGLRKQWFASDATPPMDKMPALPGMEGHSMMTPSSMHTQLESAKPFDKAFIDMMVDHHKMAIHASELEQQKGVHAELKDKARRMADQQKSEVAKLESWRTQWYGAK